MVDCIYKETNTKCLVINPMKNMHNLHKIYGMYKIGAENYIIKYYY